MAIARLQAKVGQVGKGAAHAEYIAREGKYAARLERGEKLEATEAGNMPAWAAAEPALFWQAADRHERANGTAYREFELALPRELTPDDRAALVRDWVRQEIGDRHAYQWAIHNPRAVDGGEQPHAHLMFSERQRDGIDRNPDRYFKRYNAKAPEKGGARKGYGPNAGQTLKAAERVDELKALRSRWADLVNAHLERAGLDERIDMRSYREQGIEREREGRQKPSDWHQGGKATAIEFRQMRAEQEQAAADFRQVVPVGLVSTLEDQRRRLDAIRQEIQTKAAAELAQLRAERDRNTAELTAKRAAEDAAREQERADRQASLEAKAAELVRAKAPPAIQAPAPDRDQVTTAAPAPIHPRQEQHRRDVAALLEPTPPAVPAVEAPAQPPGLHSRDFGTIPKAPQPKAPERTAEQVYADLLQPILARYQEAAAAAIETLRADRERWSQANEAHQAAKPGMVRLPGSLPKWERAGDALEQERRGFYGREMDLQRVTPLTIQWAARDELRRDHPEVVAKADAEKKAREDRERADRQRGQEAKDKERATARVGADFDAMADKRRFKMFGYHDHSDDWKATPPRLRELIDDYLALPKERRETALKSMVADPRAREEIRGLIEQRKQTLSKQHTR